VATAYAAKNTDRKGFLGIVSGMMPDLPTAMDIHLATGLSGGSTPGASNGHAPPRSAGDAWQDFMAVCTARGFQPDYPLRDGPRHKMDGRQIILEARHLEAMTKVLFDGEPLSTAIVRLEMMLRPRPKRTPMPSAAGG
jgi:hypothetical protein